MSQSTSGPSSGAPAPQPLAPPGTEYAREVLRLNGLTLSPADLEATLAEFERALEIVGPLLEHDLPEGGDQAGVFRP